MICSPPPRACGPLHAQHTARRFTRDIEYERFDSSSRVKMTTRTRAMKPCMIIKVNDINALYVDMTEQMLMYKPENPIRFIIDYLSFKHPKQVETGTSGTSMKAKVRTVFMGLARHCAREEIRGLRP